jgi:hypothetical protein
MRYVLIALGAVGLTAGVVMFIDARHLSQAMVVTQLGDIFLAVGMAATDIVEAIKGSRRS